jgi:tetratricopeptide (TPR) repeat protein
MLAKKDAPMTDETRSAEAEVARLRSTIDDFAKRRAEEPGTLFPAEADALMQLAMHLAELGQHAEGAIAAEEGVAMFRAMVEAEPATFTVHLASALNNLSNRLVEVERFDEAAAAGDSAVKLAGEAMAAKPDEARFVLVSALVNQAGRLLGAGDTAEAVKRLIAAVEAFREAGDAAAPFLGPMIEALHRAAIAFTELGLWGEALDTRRLTVYLFGDPGAPPPVVHLLALTLQQAALALGRGGNPAEALKCADEAVQLARQLIAVDAEQYKGFLAQALGTLAGARQATGQPKEGLDVALEAVNLFHEVVHLDPAGAVPALIVTLENLAAILTTLGLAEQADTVIAQRDQLRGTLEELLAVGQGGASN